MIDHAIHPVMFILLMLAIAATFICVGMAAQSAYRILRDHVRAAITAVINNTRSPDDGDKLVGYTVIICGVAFLISDYANDFAMAAAR